VYFLYHFIRNLDQWLINSLASELVEKMRYYVLTNLRKRKRERYPGPDP